MSIFGKFAENFWRFSAYFGSIAPKMSFATLWADLAEWFWGLQRWTAAARRHVLIAYIGTLIGRDMRILLSVSWRRPIW